MDPMPFPSATQFRRAIAVCLGLAALVAPYISRAIAIPFRGESWFLDYVPSIAAVAFSSAANAVHAGTLYLLATSGAHSRGALWSAAVVSLAYVSIVHFAYFDLRSSSTAGVGMISIPVYASAIGLVVWLIVGALLKRRHAV